MEDRLLELTIPYYPVPRKCLLIRRQVPGGGILGKVRQKEKGQDAQRQSLEVSDPLSKQASFCQHTMIPQMINSQRHPAKPATPSNPLYMPAWRYPEKALPAGPAMNHRLMRLPSSGFVYHDPNKKNATG